MGSVTDTNSMFFGATSFNQDISQWQLSSIQNVTDMFLGAVSFNQNLESWLSNVRNTEGILEEGFMTKCDETFSLYLKKFVDNDFDDFIYFLKNGVRVHCPPKVFPIVVSGNDKTKAFSYSRRVNIAFGQSVRGYRPTRNTITVDVNSFGRTAGAPGGSGAPPRNF